MCFACDWFPHTRFTGNIHPVEATCLGLSPQSDEQPPLLMLFLWLYLRTEGGILDGSRQQRQQQQTGLFADLAAGTARTECRFSGWVPGRSESRFSG